MSPAATVIGVAVANVAMPPAGSGFGSVLVSAPTTLYVVAPADLRITSEIVAPAVSPVVLTCHCVIVPADGIVYGVLGSLPGSAITDGPQPVAVDPLGIVVDPSVASALAVPALVRTSAADTTVIHESLARTFHPFPRTDSRRPSANAGREGSPASH